jgi:hypothetical protein
VGKGKGTVAKGAKTGSARTLSGSGRTGGAAKAAKSAAASVLTQRPVTKRANVSSAQAQSAVRSYLSSKRA